MGHFYSIHVIRLLGKPRKLIGIHREEHLWNTYDPCDVIVSHSEDIYGERAIFPLHNALKLYTEKSNNLSEQMQKHCQELHLLAEMFVLLFLFELQICVTNYDITTMFFPPSFVAHRLYVGTFIVNYV